MLGRKSFNFLKSGYMTVISLSTSVTNTIKDNGQATQAFTIKHSCLMYNTNILLNLFQADRFGKIAQNAFHSISEILPRTRARMSRQLWPLYHFRFESLIPPTLRQKLTPLATSAIPLITVVPVCALHRQK